MQLPHLKTISLTKFRDTANKELRWMAHMGGHIWLTRHGRPVAAVIPIDQAQALETLMRWDTEEYARRQADDYRAWKRAKARMKYVSWVPWDGRDLTEAESLAMVHRHRDGDEDVDGNGEDEDVTGDASPAPWRDTEDDRPGHGGGTTGFWDD